MTMNYVFYLISNWAFLYLIQERISRCSKAVGSPRFRRWVRPSRRYRRRVDGNRVPALRPAQGLPKRAAIGIARCGTSAAAHRRRGQRLRRVAGLALCFGLVELTEGAFWGAAMTVGRSDTMVVTSIMNTGGPWAALSEYRSSPICRARSLARGVLHRRSPCGDELKRLVRD